MTLPAEIPRAALLEALIPLGLREHADDIRSLIITSHTVAVEMWVPADEGAVERGLESRPPVYETTKIKVTDPPEEP